MLKQLFGKLTRKQDPSQMHEPVPGVDFPMTHTKPRYEDSSYAAVSPTQKLDLYLPQGNGPFPLVIMVHGGGFNMGDKSHLRSKAGTDELLANGYAVANVNYRLSGESRAPAQIQDLKTAVRWLRAHAREYKLNPEKFGVWGGSAGGHLAALLGTSCGEAALEGAEMGCAEQPSGVQAVVDWFAPIDFLLMDEQFAGKPGQQTHNDPYSPESILIGAPIQSRPDLVAMVNPIEYISGNTPPFLIQHGSEDDLVPVQQSKVFAAALKGAIGEEKVTLDIFEGAGHGSGPQFWDPANMRRIIAFLDQYLKDGKGSLPAKVEKIPLIKQRAANMSNGPRLFSTKHGLHFYGAYQNLSLSEKETGRSLQIEVESANRPVCWIELWHSSYDGKDWVKWTTQRGQEAIAHSGNKVQVNPTLTWTIEPGEYTVFFVNSSPSQEYVADDFSFSITIL